MYASKSFMSMLLLNKYILAVGENNSVYWRGRTPLSGVPFVAGSCWCLHDTVLNVSRRVWSLFEPRAVGVNLYWDLWGQTNRITKDLTK
jgi:hypothetical protein